MAVSRKANARMTIREATLVTLVPGRWPRRKREQVEQFILRRYAKDEEKSLYATVRETVGHILWEMLRGFLTRAYEDKPPRKADA